MLGAWSWGWAALRPWLWAWRALIVFLNRWISLEEKYRSSFISFSHQRRCLSYLFAADRVGISVRLPLLHCMPRVRQFRQGWDSSHLVRFNRHQSQARATWARLARGLGVFLSGSAVNVENMVGPGEMKKGNQSGGEESLNLSLIQSNANREPTMC